VGYILFASILLSSDHAYYYTSGKNIGQIDYDRVISSAKKAGYLVDGPYYVNTKQKLGLHPDVNELDERFGEDYRILLVKFYYTDDSGFEIALRDIYNGETAIVFFNHSKDFTAPFKESDLPPDEWITEKFKLIFDLNEEEAQYYLNQLKNSINERGPRISIKEVPNLLAVYTNFKETSSNSTFSPPAGEGLCKETLYSGNRKIGTIVYIVPNVRIIHKTEGHEYIIKIDKLGGVILQIKLAVGEKNSRRRIQECFQGDVY